MREPVGARDSCSLAFRAKAFPGLAGIVGWQRCVWLETGLFLDPQGRVSPHRTCSVQTNVISVTRRGAIELWEIGLLLEARVVRQVVDAQ